MLKVVDRWPCQPHTDQSECIYWHTAICNSVIDNLLHYDRCTITGSRIWDIGARIFRFNPHRRFPHHEHVVKESDSNTKVCRRDVSWVKLQYHWLHPWMTVSCKSFLPLSFLKATAGLLTTSVSLNSLLFMKNVFDSHLLVFVKTNSD